MQQLIECVPNFSEGLDLSIIQQITNEIESVEGVRLLNVDPGKATNRTVVTFVGNPKAVIDAAFLAIKKAGELIDMSKHKGEHPRMGATYVCPLVGRLQDQGHDALALVEQCVDAVELYGYDTKIMFSSVRTVEHVRNAINIGVHTITVPLKILKQLIMKQNLVQIV
jgi:glutamate formiminotransferase